MITRTAEVGYDYANGVDRNDYTNERHEQEIITRTKLIDCANGMCTIRLDERHNYANEMDTEMSYKPGTKRVYFFPCF